MTLNAVRRGSELNAHSVQNSNTQLNSISHALHPPLWPCLRGIMGALTYIALLVIDGDEAYAGIISDVPSSPGDSNPCPSLIKQPQGVAGGVAHRFQLLLLAFINYCGEKKKKKRERKSDNPSPLRMLNMGMLQLS